MSSKSSVSRVQDQTVTLRRGLDLKPISLQAKVLSPTCLTPRSRQLWAVSWPAKTPSSGKATGKHQGFRQQLFSCCSASPWTVSITSCSHGGTTSLKQKGQPQPDASLFSGKYFGGFFSLSRIPKSDARLPSSGFTRARTGSQTPSLGCSGSCSCPELGAQRCPASSPAPHSHASVLIKAIINSHWVRFSNELRELILR